MRALLVSRLDDPAEILDLFAWVIADYADRMKAFNEGEQACKKATFTIGATPKAEAAA